MKKPPKNTKSTASREKKALAAIIAVIVAAAVAASIALNVVEDRDDARTEAATSETEQVDTAESTNTVLTESVANLGDTGIELYNNDVFSRTGVDAQSLGSALSDWCDANSVTAEGLQVRYYGKTAGASTGEVKLWLASNNSSAGHLCATRTMATDGDETIAVAAVSDEQFEAACESIAEAGEASGPSSEVQNALSVYSFVSFDAAPCDKEDIAVSLLAFCTSNDVTARTITYQQCEGDAATVRMWCGTDDEEHANIMATYSEGDWSWSPVSAPGSTEAPGEEATETK